MNDPSQSLSQIWSITYDHVEIEQYTGFMSRTKEEEEYVISDNRN